jgi:thioredoxin 1
MKINIIILILGLVIIYGCSPYEEVNVKIENKDSETGQTVISEQTLNQLAGTTSPYYRFDKSHFEKSLEDGKVVFLDFHADWCPICLSEGPNIKAAFDELDNSEVVGYMVHYKDGRTTEDDTEMAKKYGITLQHTKVVIGRDGKVVSKSLESFSKEKTLVEINKALNQ